MIARFQRHTPAAAGKAYGAATRRAAANAAYRIDEVVAGAPGPTCLIISSFAAYGEFDQLMSDGDKIMKGLNTEEGMALQKFMLEGVVNVETQRFRVDPVQSYVPKQTRAQDPAFWMPKKPAAAKPTPNCSSHLSRLVSDRPPPTICARYDAATRWSDRGKVLDVHASTAAPHAR